MELLATCTPNAHKHTWRKSVGRLRFRQIFAPHGRQPKLLLLLLRRHGYLHANYPNYNPSNCVRESNPTLNASSGRHPACLSRASFQACLCRDATALHALQRSYGCSACVSVMVDGRTERCVHYSFFFSCKKKKKVKLSCCGMSLCFGAEKEGIEICSHFP